jgi:hypothetical protein
VPANDVEVIVCVENVNPILEGFLTDVKQLNVSIDDKTISPKFEFTSTGNNTTINGNNCEKIIFGTLSSQVHIPVVVSPSLIDNTRAVIVTQNREINVAVPRRIVSQIGNAYSPEELSEKAFLNFANRLEEYSDVKYSITVACSGNSANCIVNNPTTYIVHPYPASYEILSTSTTENEGYILIKSVFSFSYVAPVGEKLPKTPVFLEVLLSNDTGSAVYTTNVPSFDSLK